MKWWTKCISMVIAKTASRNVAFKSDKLMDALFQEGQSAPQTPQPFFDADFEDLASNAELYIFNQDDSQEYVGLGLFRLCLGLYSICCVKSLAQILLVVGYLISY